MNTIGGFQAALNTTGLNQRTRFASRQADPSANESGNWDNLSPVPHHRFIFTLSSLLGCAGLLAVLVGTSSFVASGGLNVIANGLKKVFSPESGVLNALTLPFKWFKDGASFMYQKVRSMFTKQGSSAYSLSERLQQVESAFQHIPAFVKETIAKTKVVKGDLVPPQ